ncbi:MAG: Phosphoribosyltransferase [Parcubacteria group bacterium GW2011_GWC1_35_8]|nr:MAG: Phosphoribosyltransferase [Parcubacteria group bacterium GW2011_GWC1_35_8]
MNCLSCGKAGEDLCIVCLSETPSAERETAKWIFPIYDYRHPPIKKALWLLKYNGKKRLAKIFAEIIYYKILEELSELSIMENFNDAILIPIPLSAKRYRERGYNQAELICKELIHLSKTNHLSPPSGEIFTLRNDILIKPKETEHQARIHNRAERLKNIIGSFAVKNPELLQRKNIILIDDITTTGATLSEAKKILKQYGARKIIAFTVAH